MLISHFFSLLILPSHMISNLKLTQRDVENALLANAVANIIGRLSAGPIAAKIPISHQVRRKSVLLYSVNIIKFIELQIEF